jgi:hypothetical protein
MERVKVNIRDKQFGHHSSCHMATNKYVEWVFDNEQVSKTCWFTDLCFPDVLKARPGAIKRKVAMVNEPRAIYPQVYDWISKNNKLFDFVLTYDKELLDRGENFLYYPHSRCWINNYNHEEKTNMCSIFASPKRFTPGHVMRHDVINLYRDKMDVFGKEYNPVDLKEEGLSTYRYSVTIENSIQEYYWTEKIIDCFATKTVPIFWGSKSVNDHFNSDGIIYFNNIDELGSILNNMSKDQYDSMLPAIEENFKLVDTYRIPEDWCFKQYPFLFE